MKTHKSNKKDKEADNSAIKKLDSIIEHSISENEALKKILQGLERMNKVSEKKPLQKKKRDKK
jgi:hypothetical protein